MIGTAAFSGGDLSAIALLFGLVKMCRRHDELKPPSRLALRMTMPKTKLGYDV